MIEAELDAGLVYATDVVGEPGVTGIELPTGSQVEARYPIAAASSGDRAAVADRFIDFVTGPDGQAILSKHGFGQP